MKMDLWNICIGYNCGYNIVDFLLILVCILLIIYLVCELVKVLREGNKAK